MKLAAAFLTCFRCVRKIQGCKCDQAIQRGQRLSKQAIDNLSRRRHLPLWIHALAAEGWHLRIVIDDVDVAIQRIYGVLASTEPNSTPKAGCRRQA